MASIEGKRVKLVPQPYPAAKGLWVMPSNVNNVETYANVPKIIINGPEWFTSMGTETSKGTKTFALAGDIVHPGLIEVPFGITLREIIYDVAGGIKDGKGFKAVQTGGPMGGCLTTEHLDLPVDYDALTKAGSMMGSGGMIVMDDETAWWISPVTSWNSPRMKAAVSVFPAGLELTASSISLIGFVKARVNQVTSNNWNNYAKIFKKPHSAD